MAGTLYTGFFSFLFMTRRFTGWVGLGWVVVVVVVVGGGVLR